MSIAESVFRFAEETLPNQKHNLENIAKTINLFDVPGLIEFVRQLTPSGEIESDEYDKIVEFMFETVSEDYPLTDRDLPYLNMMIVVIALAIKGETKGSAE